MFSLGSGLWKAGVYSGQNIVYLGSWSLLWLVNTWTKLEFTPVKTLFIWAAGVYSGQNGQSWSLLRSIPCLFGQLEILRSNAAVVFYGHTHHDMIASTLCISQQRQLEFTQVKCSCSFYGHTHHDTIAFITTYHTVDVKQESLKFCICVKNATSRNCHRDVCANDVHLMSTLQQLQVLMLIIASRKYHDNQRLTQFHLPLFSPPWRSCHAGFLAPSQIV